MVAKVTSVASLMRTLIVKVRTATIIPKTRAVKGRPLS